MTEFGDESQNTEERGLSTVETLELTTQKPLELPGTIKNIEGLAEFLPLGAIFQYDVENPDTFVLLGRVINPKDKRTLKRDRYITWKDFNDPRKVEKYSLDQVEKEIKSAIVLKTPPRTPENPYDEEAAVLSNLLRQRSDKKDGIITKRYLGTLFIAEDLGFDNNITWRKQQLTNLGLVGTDIPGAKTVDVGDKYIVTQGRIPKERSAVDLMKGKTAGYMFGDIPDAIERIAAKQGLTADTSRLREEAKATKFPPATIDNLKRGGNVTYKGMDNDGQPISFSTDRFGEQIIEGDDSNFEVSVTPKRHDKKEFKPGDKVENTDITCPGCGHHPFDVYERKQGKTHWLLIKKTICNDSHADGYPKKFADEFVKSIGKLPDSMRNPH